MDGADWTTTTLANPADGVRALLSPLAQTPTAQACLALICSRVTHPRVAPVRLSGASTEHPEQLRAGSARDAEPALVLDLLLSNGSSRELVIGPPEGASPSFLALDEASYATSMDHSVWARDEFKFESASDDAVDTLMECTCLLELSSTQWVVAWDAQSTPRYLVTSLLDDDFSRRGEGDLEYDELDPSLSLPELFLRAVARTLLPRSGQKLAFHPDALISPEGVRVPSGSRSWPAAGSSDEPTDE